MPTISLRLSDQELEELRVWAHDARRSIQKEIIWRLFSAEAHVGPDPLPKVGAATDEPREESKDGVASSRSPAMGGLRYPEHDDHFKPDFGGKLK